MCGVSTLTLPLCPRSAVQVRKHFGWRTAILDKMPQYRSVKTWDKARDEVSDLHGDVLLSTIGRYDGLGPVELAKLEVDHAAILDQLDRSLRALDGKLGRTEQNGPKMGERGAALSDYQFVTQRLRIQRVAVRAEPDGPLFEFGQEWLPDVSASPKSLFLFRASPPVHQT